MKLSKKQKLHTVNKFVKKKVFNLQQTTQMQHINATTGCNFFFSMTNTINQLLD